jgi:hypothetical protein
MNYHDLSTNTLTIDGSPIACGSGFIGAYKQEGHAQYINYIEQKFGQLEVEADGIIEKIDGSMKRKSVMFERGELNTLRKFLFLISYRNDRRSQQFIEERFDEATLQRIKEFQAEHRLLDIRSVWFFNLKNILDAKHWQVAGNPKIFFADRLDYIVERDWFSLYFFCAPAGCDFISTGAMGLSEGSPIQDPILCLTLDTMFGESRYWTGTQSSTEGTLNHSLSWPLTPRLLVMLSNNVVGIGPDQLSPNGDASELSYDLQRSYFHDLPKTRNAVTCHPPLSPAASYMLSAPIATFTEEHHRLLRELQDMNILDGKNVNTRVKDLITVQISELTEEQCARVNVLLLDHCDNTIVFITAKSLRRALRRYAREGRMRTGEESGVSFEILERKLEVEEKGKA